jgi:DNA-binding PadR family transcriptional regulator
MQHNEYKALRAIRRLDNAMIAYDRDVSSGIPVDQLSAMEIAGLIERRWSIDNRKQPYTLTELGKSALKEYNHG